MEEYISIIKKKLFGDNDSKTLLLNVLGNYVVKALSMLVSLLVMPAYIEYFSSQTLLGMWFTAVAIVEWVLYFDFGVGSGMRNQIMAPLHNGDRNKVKEIISAGYISVGVMVVFLIIVQHFVVETIDWYTILGVVHSDIDEASLKLVIHILLIGVCFRFFTVIVAHLLYALQQASAVGFLNLLSSVFILVYLKAGTPTGGTSDIIKLAVVQAAATNIPAVVAMIIIFRGKLKGMGPSIAFFHVSQAKSVIGESSWLFYLQIMTMLMFGVKEVLISSFVGAGQVVIYQVYKKLIGTVGTLFSLALSPIWSAVTKAMVESKLKWIRNLYKRCIQLMLLFIVGQFGLALFMPWITKIWLGEGTIEASIPYAIIYCIYNAIYMWVMMNYQFACGLGTPKMLCICLTISMAANVVLAYFLSQAYPNWITIIIATVIALIPCAIAVPKDLLRRITQDE